ncbi:hypothetical protein DES40_1177 [Litorimonas taeanensis]|uniref:Uncharacterized protein n=1 Tax=Litorimonas taeanensis TaxID=568099 RepID=A0A420WLR9_9PROT|nr:hypothetical protein [Litorimonas taeanensis]RKQ71846.1 hypothetical protein DES40_1177 [Litorimonas taeanensis]
MSLTLLAGGTIGTVLSGSGLFALRNAWKTKTAGLAIILAGWGAIFLALIAWSFAGGGADRGVSWGIIVVSLQALIFVAYSASQDKPQIKRIKTVKARNQKATSKLSALEVLKRVGTFLTVVLLCGAVSFLTALGLHECLLALGMLVSNALVTALFFFPIIWAALASVVLITRNQRLRWGPLLGLTLIGFALLLIGNGGLG